MYYLLSIFFFFFLYYLSQSYKRSTYMFLSFGLFPLMFLATFRGNVGPDTPTYLAFLEQMRIYEETRDSHEPLFMFLSQFLLNIFDNSNIVLGLFVIIFYFILFYSFKRIDKYAIIFATIIIPVFFIDMSMNAIRLGLSFSIVVFSIYYLACGKLKKYFIFGTIAGMFHISGFLLILIIYSLFTKKWKVILVSIFVSFAILYLFNDYLLTKFANYEVMSSPSKFSGITTLIISLLFMYVWLSHNYLSQNSGSIILFSFIYIFSAYAIVHISYAGLRIQNIVLYSILLAFLVHINIHNIIISNRIKLKLLGIGIIGFLFKLKNFYEGYGLVDAPFLPYTFIWN